MRVGGVAGRSETRWTSGTQVLGGSVGDVAPTYGTTGRDRYTGPAYNRASQPEHRHAPSLLVAASVRLRPARQCAGQRQGSSGQYQVSGIDLDGMHKPFMDWKK